MAVMAAHCRYCRWDGPNPIVDPHGSVFCPRCGKPAEYKIAVDDLKRHGLWKD